MRASQNVRLFRRGAIRPVNPKTSLVARDSLMALLRPAAQLLGNDVYLH